MIPLISGQLTTLIRYCTDNFDFYSLLFKNHSQLGFWIARQYVVGTKLMIKKWPQVYS